MGKHKSQGKTKLVLEINIRLKFNEIEHAKCLRKGGENPISISLNKKGVSGQIWES